MVVYLVLGCFIGWMVQLLFDHVFIRRPMKFSATRLRQLRNRLKGYEEENTTLKEQVENANVALQNTTHEVDSLNRQLSQQSTNSAQTESALSSLQIKYASKEVDLMHSNELIDELQTKLKQRPTIAADSSQEEVIAAYDEEHQIELEARSAELRAANARIKSLENELELFRTELETYDGFSTTPEDYEAKIADMRDQLDAKAIALKVANERTEALATSLEAVRISLKAKEAEIEGSPTDMQNTIDGLRLQVANQNQALISAETTYNEIKQELESTNASAVVLEAELQRRPNISVEQIDEMRELASIRETELTEADSRVAQLESALIEAQQSSGGTASLEAQLSEQAQSLTTAQSQIVALEAELQRRPDVSAEQVDEMRELASIRETELNEASTRVAQLESALIEAQNSTDGTALLETQLSEQAQSLALAQSQISALEAELVKRKTDAAAAVETTGMTPVVRRQSSSNHVEGTPPQQHSNDTLYYQISSLHADLMSMQREMKVLHQQVATRDDQIATLSQAWPHSFETTGQESNMQSKAYRHNKRKPDRDDLTEIVGVGAVYSNTFYQAGINTFKQVVELNHEKIISIIQPKRGQSIDTAAWLAQAAELAVRKGAYRNE